MGEGALLFLTTAALSVILSTGQALLDADNHCSKDATEIARHTKSQSRKEKLK